jgi:hypothetical protein
VVWLVLDCTLKFVEVKTEWKSTEIIFEIALNGGKTEVRFTHAGLLPATNVMALAPTLGAVTSTAACGA